MDDTHGTNVYDFSLITVLMASALSPDAMFPLCTPTWLPPKMATPTTRGLLLSQSIDSMSWCFHFMSQTNSFCSLVCH